MNKQIHKKPYIPEVLPGKFEAGTLNIEGAIGLGPAVDYLEEIGMENVGAHTREVTAVALSEHQNLTYN